MLGQLRPLPLLNLVLLLWKAGAEEFETVDIAKLSKLEHGTELILIESSYKDQASAYQLEDFFWTGSGDGEGDGDGQAHWKPETATTEYKTKTVLSTVYIETAPTLANQSLPKPTTMCPSDCDVPVTPTGEINPTPTYDVIYRNTTEDSPTDTDRHFWLLTVLKSEGKSVVVADLKNSLAKLYKMAFQRQQEQHLGISNRAKRETAENDKPVNVIIHNVAKSPIDGEERIEVLYHVSVSGQPVTATTAAADMHLVSDEEVTSELGYPFIIKAEPYLKVSDPQYLATTNNTWVFIGVALAILFVLLLFVALLTLALSKHGKNRHLGLLSKRQIFQESVSSGNVNNAFTSPGVERREYESGRRRESSTYINFRSQASNQTLKSGIFLGRPHNSSSSSSLSSSSLDISPLMTVKRRQQTPPKRAQPARPKAALNKTVPITTERRPSLALDTDSSSDRTKRDSSDTILIKNYDPGVVSPKSYLSMPSVKSFPRGNMPEPLNKVLEPVSVLHLDIADDDYPDYVDKSRKGGATFTRHGSLSTIEDPGVIGPVVWNAYCKRLQHGASTDEKLDDLKMSSNTRMRKRFHELLDETFSLFGSRRESPTESNRPVSLEVKSHSAMTNRPEEVHVNTRPRPKTSGARRLQPENEPPRGAWATNAPSPLSRPVSAGPICRSNITPEVDVDRVLADGNLPPNDPAVPLIAAIKTELNKCSLPGSTTNLAE